MMKLVHFCVGLQIILALLSNPTHARAIAKRGLSQGAPLTSCPSGNNATIIAGEKGYNLCSLSQYNVPSQSWPVVANDTACAALCGQTNGCTTAVFDRTAGNCHIKGNPSPTQNNWIYDNRFDAIILAYTPQQLATVNGSCPFGGYSYTDSTGNLYSVCPLTDYPVNSLQVIPNIYNATTCASLCTSTNNCANAVFDHEYNYCHIKGTLASNAPWDVNQQFDTIQLISAATPTTPSNPTTPTRGTPITSCPAGNNGTIIAGNLGYNLCQYSEYEVPSLSWPVVANDTACAALCAQTNGCTTAVFDRTGGNCNIKGNPSPNNWEYDDRFDAIVLAYTPQQLAPVNGTCPFGGYSYTDPTSANNYTVCPLTDYPVNSLQVIPNIYNQTSCASLCTPANSCTNAVFDHEYNYCHIKGTLASNAPWDVNQQFDTIQLVSVSAQSANASLISAACPYGGGSIYTTKSGLVTIMCPNSDFQTGNLAVVPASSMQQCAEICSTTSGCYNVVYAAGSCSIKGAPYEPNMAQSNYYSTITVANTTANNKILAPLNGQWGDVIPLDVNPVAAYLVPAYPTVKKFLSFASWSPSTFGGDTQYSTSFASFDVTSDQQGQWQVSNTQHNMFCPGMNSLPDGRLVIDGGDTDDAVSIYNPFTNTFSRAANMTMGRGYQASVTTSQGKAFTIGGSFTGGIGGQDGCPMKNGEVYDPVANTWTALPNALVEPMLTTYDNAGAWRTDNHAWLYAWSGGSVFQAGPSKNMNWYSTNGTGAVQSAGQRNANNDQMCGVNVMYDNGKIFSAAGAQSYSDDDALNVVHQIILNGVNQNPTVNQLPGLTYPRAFANAIVLPNGQILIAGGQQYAEVFTDTESVLQAEVYDPVKQTSTVVAPAAIPRNYHSSALLLPDGRVMSGGGGLCYVGGDCNDANHQDLQIYSPPYLFDSKGNPTTSRPTVTSIKGSQQKGSKVMVNPGGTLTVALKNASGLSHVLIRMGSATHSVDTDQRRIPLTVTKTSKNTVTLSVPNDNGIVPPGFWYYFAVSSTGLHSIGMTVNVLQK